MHNFCHVLLSFSPVAPSSHFPHTFLCFDYCTAYVFSITQIFIFHLNCFIFLCCSFFNPLDSVSIFRQWFAMLLFICISCQINYRFFVILLFLLRIFSVFSFEGSPSSCMRTQNTFFLLVSRKNDAEKFEWDPFIKCKSQSNQT